MSLLTIDVNIHIFQSMLLGFFIKEKFLVSKSFLSNSLISFLHSLAFTFLLVTLQLLFFLCDSHSRFLSVTQLLAVLRAHRATIALLIASLGVYRVTQLLALASLTPFLFLLLVGRFFFSLTISLFFSHCVLNIFIPLKNYLLWVYLNFGWAWWWALCVCQYTWKRKRETFWLILVLILYVWIILSLTLTLFISRYNTLWHGTWWLKLCLKGWIYWIGSDFICMDFCCESLAIWTIAFYLFFCLVVIVYFLFF